MQKDTRVLSEKLKDEIIESIAVGILEQDMMLPSVRVYANRLGVNPNTVQKTYQKLESEGHIHSIPKKGSFVKNAMYSKQIFQKQLMNLLQNTLNKLETIGIEKSEILDQLKKEVK